MDYSEVASAYAELEKVSGRNDISRLLSELLLKTPKSELKMLAYLTQGRLKPDYEGVELGLAEKMALRAVTTASGQTADAVFKAYIKFGDIGSAAEELLEGRKQGTLYTEGLTLKRVYDTFVKVAGTGGEGSVESKLREVVSLLNDASPVEAKFIMRTVTGQLRLGVADYTVLDASAIAFLGGKERRPQLERAYNLHPDLGLIVELAATGGTKAIESIEIVPGIPIRPMLAERLGSVDAILKKMGGKEVASEYKLDGERLQIHKRGDSVVLFSRRLEVITSHYPDAGDLVRTNVAPKNAILEAEVVAIDDETGEYLPFQELMHRRRKHGIDEAVAKYPVALNFFDILMLGSRDLTQKPYSYRRKKLLEAVRPTDQTRLVPSLVSSDPAEVERFMEDAISNGCEGLVVKDLDSTYRAGAREFAWIKLKREYRSQLTDTIDLPIVGAFHGKGRRAGTYGTFLLAAYDKKRGVYSSIAKIGTGFTDEDLARFPKLLKPFESHVRPPNVESEMVPDIWFRPHVVIETIAAELTLSPIHIAAMGRIRPSSGISLRFPKFTGKVRDDKSPEDSTSVDELVEMYQRQIKKVE